MRTDAASTSARPGGEIALVDARERGRRQNAEQTGISVECIQSPTRVSEVVQARRVTLVLGHQYVGRTISELGALVGLSTQAASKLLRARTHRLASADAVSRALFARLVSPHELDVGEWYTSVPS